VVGEVLPQLFKLKGVALDLFFPQNCLGCRKEGELLCRDCQKSLPRIPNPICPKCGRPQTSNILCPRCNNWHSDIESIRSPLKFTGVIREAIHQFKYKNLRSLAKPLAIILQNYWIENTLPVKLVIPVPLHPKRLRERGYNQSSLLAREFSRLVNLPFCEDYLTRVKYISPQAKTQSIEERLRNVDQAFTCKKPLPDNIAVLLIDDVSTSGATLDACAKALKSAGTCNVYGLTLAREI
jgi:ComF family protein